MMNKGRLLYEGKAKRIYETGDAGVVWVEYKDSATAFNGEKKEDITGKGKLNNEITSILFEILKDAGIANHFVEKISDTEQLVKQVQIIPLEVVVRNVVAGSLATRIGLAEGTKLETPIIEFYYKNDELGDPLLNEQHIQTLNIASPEQRRTMEQLALAVNEVLLPYFLVRGIRLIDFKLEFGVDHAGNILLADEISPDTCRLWDEQTNEKFDKDVFRRSLGSLTAAYQEILQRITREV